MRECSGMFPGQSGASAIAAADTLAPIDRIPLRLHR
jgi:hypothetical protein